MKTKKLLLVTGTMRTGTTWMAQALKLNGLDCPHEYLGKDGCVSWFYSIDTNELPIRPNSNWRHVHKNDGLRSNYKFGTVVHLVRDPLKVLSSMQAVMPTHEQEWLVRNGIITGMDCKPKLKRMLQAWVGINARVERIADLRLRLEDLTHSQEPWDQLGERLKMQLVRPRLGVRNRSRGIFRRGRPPTLNQLFQLDPFLMASLRGMARRYGYDL